MNSKAYSELEAVRQETRFDLPRRMECARCGGKPDDGELEMLLHVAEFEDGVGEDWLCCSCTHAWNQAHAG